MPKALKTKAIAHPEEQILERVYKGKTYRVESTRSGYIYNGSDNVYKSLTAVAQAITGYKNISGPAFFGVAKKKQPVAA